MIIVVKLVKLMRKFIRMNRMPGRIMLHEEEYDEDIYIIAQRKWCNMLRPFLTIHVHFYFLVIHLRKACK